MPKRERGLTWAVRITPRADRERYETEWRSDLDAAERMGLGVAQVGRGALAVAARLRLREIEATLLGRRGAPRALSAWGGVLVAAILAFMVGQIGIALFLGVWFALIAVAVQAGSPSRWSRRLMAASVVVGFPSAAFFWWSWGVTFDAVDTGAPVPFFAAWEGPALLIALGSVLVFFGAAVIAIVNAVRRPSLD